MNLENIIIKNVNDIAIVSINRPEALNALNTNVLRELDQVITAIEKDERINVIILTGEGKAFVAGADIVEMKDMTASEGRVFGAMGTKVFRNLELMEKPVIAAINGFALGGGCELAMCCDIRIAGEKAKFGQPEVGLGITPGFAGTQRMTRLLGAAKSKELIFTGDIIDASEAHNVGLVNKVVKQDLLMDEAIILAKKIASKGQIAVRYSKKAINRGVETDIETGMAIENDLFGLCFATEDQKEGMKAFIENRKPNFKTL